MLASGCGRSDEDGGVGGGSQAAAAPGVTKTAIKLGGSYPFSGPASAYASIASGVKARFAAENAKGGVDGRKIEFVALDDGYEPQRAVTNARRLVEQEKVFALFNTLGTPNNLAIWDYLNQQKVPQLYVATGASAFGADVGAHPFTTGWQPDYVSEAKAYAEFLKAEKPKAKVAVLFQNDGFGKDLLGGFEKAIEGSDIKIVARESYEVTDPTITLADAQAGVLRRRHVPEHHDAEVLRAGDRGDRQVRLEAAAHPQQRRRLEEARARTGGAEERRGHRLDDLLQGPRGPAVGRRRRDAGVQGRHEASSSPRPTRRRRSAPTAGPRRRP